MSTNPCLKSHGMLYEPKGVINNINMLRVILKLCESFHKKRLQVDEGIC